MADTFTLSGNVATLPGVPFVVSTSTSQVDVFVVASEPTITDTETNVTRLGTFKTVVDVDGSFTAAGLPSTADTAYMPSGFSYRIAVRYRDAVTGSERRYESNWFALTADTNFADVVNVELTSIDQATYESLIGARDQAVAAKVAAQAAAAAAAQLATSDGQTAANVAGGTLTKSALSASTVGRDARGVTYGPNGWPGPLNVSNDPAWSTTDLPHPLGEFTAALASRFINPDPPDVASGGLVNAAVITQVEGAAGSQPLNKLFLDAQLIRLGLKSYSDAAVTAFAAVTGSELDIAIDGAGTDVKDVRGYYVVPILGQVSAASGEVDTIRLIQSDSLQIGTFAGAMRIRDIVGIYAARPVKVTNPNLTVDSQYALVSEPGTLIQTDYNKSIAWLGIADVNTPANIIWQRINSGGNLEFCKTDGTVLATITTGGIVTAKNFAATAKVFRTLTSPPVSGTIYQNTLGAELNTSLTYTPGAAAGSIKVEVSPDNFATVRTWVDRAFGASESAAQIQFPIPVNWRYRVTLTGTGATLGAHNAMG